MAQLKDLIVTGDSRFIGKVYGNLTGNADTATGDKNGNDITTTYYKASNPNGYTSNTGTITGITMNGASKGSSGVVDLGTVITAHQDISGKQDKITSTNKLDYSLISNTPTIPSAVTETTVSGWGFTKNAGTVTSVAVKMNNTTKGTITTNGTIDLGTVITAHQDISGKQDKLVSGTNIKTINSQSILGSGDITIEGGGKIFYGVYGTTTYNELLTAYNDNKFIFIYRADNTTIYSLTRYTSNTFYFRSFGNSTNINYGIYISSTGNWTANSYTYATLSSPEFTGTPKAPTAAAGTNTTQIATTAFVNAYHDSTKQDKITSSNKLSYSLLSGTPTIPSAVTETTVSGWGFTKNSGTITGIKMNGSSKGTSGVVDLGTVLTSHQDISGKVNKSGDTMTGNLTAPNLTASNGYLYTTCNGCTTQIGSQNSSYCHYSTGAPMHWFNKEVHVQGSLFKGPSYNLNVPAVFIQSGTPSASQTGDIWFS